MKPKFLDGKWYIEVETDVFGKVLLLDKTSELPIPVEFENEKDALDYIEQIENSK